MTEIAPVIYHPVWKRTKPRLFVLGAAVLTLVAVALGLWPGFVEAQSGAYLTAADRAANLQDRELDLKVSIWLKPSGDANLGLVKLYLSQDREAEAVALFNSTGAGAESSRLKLLIDMEADRGDQAAKDAADLTKASQTDADRLLATLVYTATQNTAAADATMALLGHSEALERAKRARGSMTGLGIEMAAAGLPKSAERFLVKQPAGFARNATLADIAAARGGETNLGQARDYYQSALTFKPDSAELRGKLASVLDRLGDTTAAAVQRQLVSKIEAGKP